MIIGIGEGSGLKIRRKALHLALGAMIVTGALASGVPAFASSTPPGSRPAAAAPTAAERAQLARVLATPQGRAKLVSALDASFGRFARVSVGSGGAPVRSIRPDLADGIAWDHIWVIASFADVYRGLVTAAVGFCLARSPVKWICPVIGGFLVNMTNGHGWSDSHGVWAAYYWWPYLHETGGFW